MDLLNEAVLLKTKSTLFNLLIRKTSKFYAMNDCLTWPMWHAKNAFFREMQFWSHCYTVVSYQALFRLSVYNIPAVYLSGAKKVCFCTIRDFGSPTMNMRDNVHNYKSNPPTFNRKLHATCFYLIIKCIYAALYFLLQWTAWASPVLFVPI